MFIYIPVPVSVANVHFVYVFMTLMYSCVTPYALVHNCVIINSINKTSLEVTVAVI